MHGPMIAENLQTITTRIKVFSCCLMAGQTLIMLNCSMVSIVTIKAMNTFCDSRFTITTLLVNIKNCLHAKVFCCT